MKLEESTKQIIDAGAGVVTIGAILEMVPEITAVLSLIWVVIRILETETIKNVINKCTKKDD
jgi:hypothetical protein